LYSHVHSNISLSFLSCEPDFSQTPGYKDQAEIFYSAPLRWLEDSFPRSMQNIMPDSFILFDKLEAEIKPFLTGRGFTLGKSFFHSHAAEGRVGHNVLVYCKELGCVV